VQSFVNAAGHINGKRSVGLWDETGADGAQKAQLVGRKKTRRGNEWAIQPRLEYSARGVGYGVSFQKRAGSSGRGGSTHG